MKRTKRNRIKRAFEKGYQLGLAGRSKENCPFLTGLARIKWLEGWKEGRNDWREGLTDALTCYKLSGFRSVALRGQHKRRFFERSGLVMVRKNAISDTAVTKA